MHLACSAGNTWCHLRCPSALRCLPQITVVAGEVIRRYASGAMTEEQEPQDRHPQGE